MKRLLAVFIGLAALVFLSSFLLRDIASVPTQEIPVVAAAESNGQLQLELSRRLASPPAPDSLPADKTRTGWISASIQSFVAPFRQLDMPRSRPLIYLLCASLIGLLLGLMTRRPATAKLATTSAPDPGLITQLRSELDERSDAIHDLEREMERRASATAETLNLPLQEQLSQYEHDLSIVKEDLTARDARIATQSAELEEKTHRLRELENEISGLGERDQPMERRLGEQTRDIVQLEQELSTRRSEVIALQEELAVAHSRCDNLESQRAEMRGQIEELTDSASSSGSELEESRKNLAAGEIELANWQDSVKSLEKEIAHRAETIERLEEDLSERDQRVNSLRVERDGLRDTLAILQARLDERQGIFETERLTLQQQGAELESELEARTRQLGFVDETQGERDEVLEELRREVEASQQQIISLETDLGDLQNQKEKMNTWQSTLDTFKSDLRTRDGIIGSLHDEVARLADTEQQVLDQRETIAELENELDKQTTLAQALKRGVDSLREFKEQAARYERDIAQLNEELQNTQKESDEFRGRIPPLEKTLLLRDDEIARLQQDTQANTREMQELEQELADWRVKMTAMESGLRERDAGLDDLRSDLDSSREQVLELNDLEPQLDQLNAELATVKQQFDLEVRARQTLEAELEELKVVEEKLAAWDSTITTLRSDLRERERTLDAVLDDFSMLVGGQVSVAGWAAAVNDVKSNLDERDRENALLRTDVERLELQSAEDVERLELQSAETEALRHQLEEHQADLDAMRSEIERTQGAVRRADEAEITLEKNREAISGLEQAIKEKSRRIDDLELDTTDWINKYSTLNSKYESQGETMDKLETEISHLQERFEAQRETILKMRADKLSKDDVDELPTLTTIIRSGERPAKD